MQNNEWSTFNVNAASGKTFGRREVTRSESYVTTFFWMVSSVGVCIVGGHVWFTKVLLIFM